MRKIHSLATFFLTFLLLFICPNIYAEETSASDTSSVVQVTTEQVTNNNNTDAATDHTVDANTGENTSEEVIAETNTQETGDITIADSITTTANTNVVGTDTTAQTIDVTTADEELDLSSSSPRPCLKPGEGLEIFLEANNISFEEFVTIINTNNANILNTISIDANTGNNSASGVGDISIRTGDIDATVNISTTANTNIVGDCNYFVIINIYADSNGDIILPYEFSANEDSESSTNTSITNTNSADIENSYQVSATTGDNSASDVTTGDVTIGIQDSTTANNTIVGNNWIKLSINTFGNWTGQLLDWLTGTGEVSASEKSSSEVAIENTNNAQVTNNVTVNANTGENTIDGTPTYKSEITTGDIDVNINTFNFLNNTMVGNNWWYAIVNIFGNFSGNIIIARPDLYAWGSSSKNLLNSGDEGTFTMHYGNHGRVHAMGNSLSTTLPDYLELLDLSEGGVLNGTTITWPANDCLVGTTDCGSVWVRARLRYGSTITDGLRHLSFTVHTNMRESASADNVFGIPYFAYVWTLDEKIETSNPSQISYTPNSPTIPNKQLLPPNIPILKTKYTYGTLAPAAFTDIPNVLSAQTNQTAAVPINTHSSQLGLLGAMMGILLSRRILTPSS